MCPTLGLEEGEGDDRNAMDFGLPLGREEGVGDLFEPRSKGFRRTDMFECVSVGYTAKKRDAAVMLPDAGASRKERYKAVKASFSGNEDKL